MLLTPQTPALLRVQNECNERPRRRYHAYGRVENRSCDERSIQTFHDRQGRASKEGGFGEVAKNPFFLDLDMTKP